jgi:transcriptional regulator
MRAFVAEHSFGALFLSTPNGPRVAHAPAVFLDEALIGFHLARGNALTPHLDGARALFVVQGPHGYVSPDWYGIADQVPTWNYLAVEVEGRISPLDEAALAAQVDALSAMFEGMLAPKPAWTRDKMTPGRFEAMLPAIRGFELTPAAWRGTRKMGQNKTTSERAALVEALTERDQTREAALVDGKTA